jgi:hypothetical protein
LENTREGEKLSRRYRFDVCLDAFHPSAGESVWAIIEHDSTLFTHLSLGASHARVALAHTTEAARQPTARPVSSCKCRSLVITITITMTMTMTMMMGMETTSSLRRCGQICEREILINTRIECVLESHRDKIDASNLLSPPAELPLRFPKRAVCEPRQ